VADDDYVRLFNCLRGPERSPSCGDGPLRVYLDADWDVDLQDFASFKGVSAAPT